jgi:hypothetical protein
MPPKRWSSADFDVVIARVTPDIVALLGDGCAPLQDRDRRGPRRPAPEGRRPAHAVTEQLVETGSKYTLPAAEVE